MSRRQFELQGVARGMEPADLARLAAAHEREEERWRRACSAGIIGTVLLHFLLLILFRTAGFVPISEEAAAGPPMGDIRAAAGGSGLTMVDVSPERPPPIEETPVPVPVPVPEEIVVIPEEVVEVSPPAEPTPDVTPSAPGTTTPGSGGQDGPDAGPGTSTGSGAGGGGTADSGASQIVPPTPRGVFIPPPGQPASARGQEITVWVLVTEVGRVERGSIRLEPPTSDSRYNQRLIQSVAEWVFDPARQAGRAVEVWYPFQIIL